MTDGEPTLDRIFDLLGSRRRRYALYYLNETDADVVTLDDVADRIVTWEREWAGDDDADRDTQLEYARTALHHNHLPRLADAGLVDYDPRSRTVRRWDEPSLEEWAKDEADELPYLWELLTASEA